MEATEVRKLAELERGHWWYRERRHILRDMVGDGFPDGVHGRRALDVGAAAGGNTVVLRDLGMMAVALEYGAEGVALAQGRGLAVVRGDACHLPVADTSVDLVTAFDVLEHIDDHDLVMSEIRRVLAPGGQLFVAVPCDMRLWSAHDEAVGHVRRYSRTELRGLTEDAGLQVEAIWSWNVLLRSVVAMRRRRSAGSDLTRLNPVVNAALSGVVALERNVKLLRRAPGVSLMLRARRIG